MTAGHRQVRFVAPPGATRILLVRHGESMPFVDGEPFALVDGHADPALYVDGEEQARRVGERLAAEGEVRAIYVTPLQRTAQTAAPLAARLGIEPRVEPDLREVHLGEWEGGGLRKHARTGHPLIVQIFAEQRWDVVPGAEPTDAFDARVRAGVERIAAAHPDETVAAFVHGGVIGSVLSQATGAAGLAFVAADNGSISEIVVIGERWAVRRYNDTAHLIARTDAGRPHQERRPERGKG
jgi:probable phosphoglycerate mutase